MTQFYLSIFIVLANVAWASADDSLERYFQGLRDRQLFFVAESYGLGRLADANVLASERIAVAVQLAKTYCEHATIAAESERAEYWERAKQVLAEVRGTSSRHPRVVELNLQAAKIPAERAEFLGRQLALYPDDSELRADAETTVKTAIQQLSTVEESLRQMKPQPAVDSLDLWELKSLRQTVWLALGRTWLLRAEITDEAGSLAESAKWLEQATHEKADRELTARARIAWAANLRRQQQLGQAERLLQAVSESQPSLEIADMVVVERVQQLLAEGNSPDAAELLQKHRQRTSRVSGELAFWHVKTLAALRKVTVDKQQTAETERLEQLIHDTAERAEILIGGYWSVRCQRIWQEIQDENRYGPQIAKLVRRAETAIGASDWSAALKQYETAIAVARKSGRDDVAVDLGETQASILIRLQNYSAAAGVLETILATASAQPHTAELDLLHAICVGKIYQSKPSSANRTAYTQELKRHLDRYANFATAAEARWMLGSLQEARLQHTEAITYFEAIPLTHPRGPSARTAIARCYHKIIRWLESLETREDDSSRRQTIATKRSEWERQAIENLSQWIMPFPETATDSNAWQGEIAVWVARIHLERNPPRFAAAEGVIELLFQQETVTSIPPRWSTVRSSANFLRVLALAGMQRLSDAKTAAKTLEITQPARHLDLLRDLQALDGNIAASSKRTWGELLLLVAGPLANVRDSLAPGDRDMIDLARARAFTVVGQSERAAKIYASLVAKGSADAKVLAAAAENLGQETNPQALANAQAYWQKVEKKSTPGSEPWFAARFHNLELMLQRNQTADFQKLLGVTKILYPQLGGPAWQAKFEQLEQRSQQKTK